MLPQRFVYISTSGVYGDCAGEWIDEQRATDPATPRAKRRLDAETAVTAWGAKHRVETVILRAPGIYASDRLPLERLAKGMPALRIEDDVYSNHIHADDLAAILVAALEVPQVQGVYNACDDAPMKIGDFLDLVADRTGHQRPPRLPREEIARVLPPDQLSFMSESRRISNRRMKTELGVSLRHPSVQSGVPRLREIA